MNLNPLNSSMPGMMGNTTGSARVEACGQDLHTVQDRLDTLTSEKADLEKQMEKCVSGRTHNKKACTVTRTLALAGGAVFLAGALMASMVPFAAGCAFGAVNYIASGYFKGRTEWFTRETAAVSSSLEKVQTEQADAQKAVNKMKSDISTMAASVAADLSKDSAIKDEESHVFIDGIRLDKKWGHLGSVVDDLFGKLSK